MHFPKSRLPPTRRIPCQLSNFDQSVHAGSQNPQETKNGTHEILVFACLFSQKNYVCMVKKPRHESQNDYSICCKLCLKPSIWQFLEITVN